MILTALSASDAFAKAVKPGKHAGKADRAIAKRLTDSSGKRMRVIVKTRSGATVSMKKRASERGGKFRSEYRRLKAFAAELDPRNIQDLLNDPDVLGVSIDAPVGANQFLDSVTSETAVAAESSTLGGTLSDGQKLRQTLGVLPISNGRGVGVAIVDSGIAPTADLRGRIAAFYDFTRSGVAATPSDKYGHGTHIAGLIAGSGYKSNGKYMGVAPSTRLIGLKVLDDKGAGYTSDVIAAVEFATANKAALGIDVMNLSLGHPIYEPAATDPLVQAVEKAVDAGIVVVISAGNIGMNPTTGKIGYAGITSPGNAPSALTVGAVRHRGTTSRADDVVSDFSSRGPTWYDGLIKPDVLAPGQALVATMDPGAYLYQNPAVRADYPGYAKLSGTSMAAGVASGVVALMIDANRRDEGLTSRLTPNTVKALLQYSAIPVTDPDPATPAALEQGTGAINATGAVVLAWVIDPTTAAGSPWLEYGVTPFSFFGGQPVSWSQHIVWGDHVVWGDSALWSLSQWADHIVWGDSMDHVVWGDSLDSADHIVWGDSFLQGANLVAESFLAWSNHVVWGDSTDHVVWGDSYDHVVWGDSLLDHIVWGDSVLESFDE